MTKEHLSLALSLSVPVFIVVTKVDMCPEQVIRLKFAELLVSSLLFLSWESSIFFLVFYIVGELSFIYLFRCFKLDRALVLVDFWGYLHILLKKSVVKSALALDLNIVKALRSKTSTVKFLGNAIFCLLTSALLGLLCSVVCLPSYVGN